MENIALPGAFLSNGGGATPVNSNGLSWNTDMVTTTGNVIIDLLHNFHLECGARIHKLRVYETMKEPTGREVCGYLLVRGSVHAHAYALALKKLTGVEIEKMLPTPNINLDRIPECQKYLNEGKPSSAVSPSARTTTPRPPASGATARWRCRATRRESWRWWTAMPAGRAHVPELLGNYGAFAPNYAPEEMFDIASQALQEVPLAWPGCPSRAGRGALTAGGATPDECAHGRVPRHRPVARREGTAA